MKQLKSMMLLVVASAMNLMFIAACDSENGSSSEVVHEHSFTDGKCECGEQDPNYEPHVHSYETVVTAPTCTEKGYTTYTCECGDSYVGDEVAAPGHTFTEGTCGVCGSEDPNYVPHVHSYEAVVTAPTCTEKGYTTYTCECSDSYIADEVPATNHTYEEVVTAPTCTEKGYTTYTCHCGDSYVADEVPATNHTYEEVVTAPTCTEKGYTTYTCHCSHSYTDSEVAALGHKFIDNVCSCGAEFSVQVGGWTLVTEIKDGDKVLIGAPAYNKLLSVSKVATYYNKGVDYSATDFSNVTDQEIFVVAVNSDGTYTFTSLTGKVIAVSASFSSLDETSTHKSWTLIEKTEGIFYLKNATRGNYLEWYDSKGNWSTYATSSLSDLFELSFYAQAEEKHEHNYISSVHAPTCTDAGYTAYTCRCGDTYSVAGEEATGHTYEPVVTEPTCTEAGYTTHTCECGDSYTDSEVQATGHTYTEGTCETCGAADPDYVAPVAGGSADFNTIVCNTTYGGDSSYTKTFTTASGWVTTNSAIQAGGTTDMNPNFTVVGPDSSYKAICLNGKVSAPGKITSPTLTGGISKISINYTKMFTDTNLSVTITVTDLATGTQYTHDITVTLDKNDKYTVYSDEWTLETPVSGDFTIEVINNCPSKNTGNKDRMTILSLSWEGAAETHTHEYEATTTATCVADGITTYTCSCGDTYTEETAKLGHIDENLDIDCDREGCTSKVAPAPESTLSNATANHLGSKLSTSNMYYVEGVIVEVLDAKNGIFLIDDGTGETFYFRLPKNAEDVSHANWEFRLVLGDRVKVYGKINKYSTTSAPNGQYYPAIQGGLVTILEQHTHVFDGATCKEPAFCDCLLTSGDPLGHIDEDGNSLCDRCQFNVNLILEGVEVRTDNNSGVTNEAKTATTWTGTNFDVIVDKGSGSQLYTTEKDHMRIYKNNTVTISNKNEITIRSIIIYVTNTTQLGNLEKMLTGLTYSKNEEELTITIEWNSNQSLVLTNTGSTTQIKNVEITYDK